MANFAFSLLQSVEDKRGAVGGLALAMEGLSLSLPSELQRCAVTWSGVGLRDSGGTVSLWMSNSGQ
jgi:hypothetical protein